MKEKHKPYILAAIVSLLTLAVYLSAVRNDFVLWDDDMNVINNYSIRAINWKFAKWAFTTVYMSLWQPVVWISYAFDYSVWGLRPEGYHLTNVLLHVANTFLVVCLLVKLLTVNAQGYARSGPVSSSDGRMILIAAGTAGLLFGLHPLHVEPAAWIAGRTDLFCTLFYLVSIAAYINYATAGKPGDLKQERKAFFRDKWYLLSLFLFGLSLASKAMAITLPVVLLILDWHPLGRTGPSKQNARLFLEKIPFIGLSVAVSIAAYRGWEAFPGVTDLQAVPLAGRLLVATQSLILYLGKMTFPLHLSPFYPYPGEIAFFSFQFGPALILVCGITAASLYFAGNRKILPAVWAYYVITVLPTLGIIKARPFSMADRYLYLPSIGPFLLLGLASAWLWSRAVHVQIMALPGKRIMAVLAIVLCIVLSALTLRQIAIWKNTITLWSRVIDEEPVRVPVAYNNRGLAFREQGQFDRALDDFNRVVALETPAFKGYNNRDMLLQDMKRLDLAERAFSRAIALNPRDARAYLDRGIVLGEIEQYRRAIADFNMAIQLDAGHADTYIGRGLVFERMGRPERALEDYNAAIEIDPASVDAYLNRGVAYGRMDQFDRAVIDYSKAIELKPDDYLAHSNRALALAKLGRIDEAIEDHTKVISLKPGLAQAYLDRGDCYREAGKSTLAMKDYQKACSLGNSEGCAAVRTQAMR